MVQFTIPGKPFAKERPKAVAVAGRARVYTPAATVSFESKVTQIARPAFSVPFEGPVLLRVVAVFEIPKSWTKARKAGADGAYHIQKPDADNLLKGFATGGSMLLSTFISWLWLGFEITPGFALGASMVLGSMWVYACAETN